MVVSVPRPARAAVRRGVVPAGARRRLARPVGIVVIGVGVIALVTAPVGAEDGHGHDGDDPTVIPMMKKALTMATTVSFMATSSHAAAGECLRRRSG
jgi:hypothetical protein